MGRRSEVETPAREGPIPDARKLTPGTNLGVAAATATAAAASAAAASRGNTPVADHFVALPGGDDEAEASRPPYKPFRPRRADGERGFSKPASACGATSNPAFGMEALLGSKAAAAGSKNGFAASAKSTIISGLEMLTAAAAKAGTAAAAAAAADAGAEQSDYVAMATPCESPVSRAAGTAGSVGSLPPLALPPPPAAAVATTPPLRPSASSRAGLAARLGSALQSWALLSGGGGADGGGGAFGYTGPPREGRPGPLGAKYMQHVRLESPVLAGVPAAASSGTDDSKGNGDGRGKIGSGITANVRTNVGATLHKEGEEEGLNAEERGLEEEALEELEGRGAPDMVELEPRKSKLSGKDLIRLEGEAAGMGAGSTVTSPRELGGRTDTQADERQERQPEPRADGDVEAGAGSADAQTIAARRSPRIHSSPAAAAAAAPAAAAAAAAGAAAGSSAASSEEDSGARVEMVGAAHEREQRGGEVYMSSGSWLRGRAVGGQQKAVGLWEIKAERNRLDKALAKAEMDRDVERARAKEAASRLGAEVARLENLRLQLCGRATVASTAGAHAPATVASFD